MPDSSFKPIMPRCNLLETAEYGEYARWCERGRPRGIPLLDSSWPAAKPATAPRSVIFIPREAGNPLA